MKWFRQTIHMPSTLRRLLSWSGYSDDTLLTNAAAEDAAARSNRS